MRSSLSLAVIALTLAAAPTLALAGGCAGQVKDTTAANCVAGMVWDADKSTCVDNPTT